MGEIRKPERADANQVGGAHGAPEGGATERMPNEAQLGGTGAGSLGELARSADQHTPATGQSGPGDGEGRGPTSDKASSDD